VTLIEAVVVVPTPLVAVKTIALGPSWSGMEAVQAVPPVAVPVTPVVAFVHVIEASTRSSAAVPAKSSGVWVVMNVGELVGAVIPMVGAAGS